MDHGHYPLRVQPGFARSPLAKFRESRLPFFPRSQIEYRSLRLVHSTRPASVESVSHFPN